MARTRIQAPPISNSLTLTNLQSILIGAFNYLVSQLNNVRWAQDPASQNVDLSNNRINNLANPAAPLDAVNLITLQKAIADAPAGTSGSNINTATIVVSASIQIAER